MNTFRAIKICRELEQHFKNVSDNRGLPRAHVCLGGGTLFSDDERKDADIFVYFHDMFAEPSSLTDWHSIIKKLLEGTTFYVDEKESISGMTTSNCSILTRGTDVVDLVYMNRPK